MQSTISRSALRALPQTARASNTQISHTARRTYASGGGGVQGNTGRETEADPRKGNGLIFAIGGVVFVAVAGRYFVASNRRPGGGYKDRQEAREGTDPSKEFRDPRDSGVKTLGQKKEKQEREARE